MKAIFIALIRAYRFIGSPAAAALGARCRFHPSCSQYALMALSQHKLVRALSLIGWRLVRCSPWSEGGEDPVPESPA